MNFLAHYYTTDEAIDPYVLLGLIMPDLVKDFSKIYNNKNISTLQSNNRFIQKMLNGVALHVKGDAIFHEHTLFLEFEAEARKILIDSKTLLAKRKYIIAHVLIELMLDQYIIKKSPRTISKFYNLLEEIELEKANEFYSMLRLDEKEIHFKKNITIFRDRKFLYKLENNEGIIFTLDKVFGKLFKTDFMAQGQLWSDLIDNVKVKMNTKLDAFFIDLKQKINE